MPDKKQLNEGKLEKVSGGADIVNSSKSEEELEKEDIEREIRALQSILNSGGQSYKESMELMSKITALMRQLQGYDNPNPIKNAE